MGGTDKAALRLGKLSLLDIALSNLALSMESIALCSGCIDVAAFNLPQLTDHKVDGSLIGPAGALLAALEWAESERLAGIITLPVDTPILPEKFCEHLVAAGGSAYAWHNARDHWMHAAWSVKDAPSIKASILKDKNYALHRIHAAIQSQPVKFGQVKKGAFHNINTPDDLAAARRYSGL